MAPSPGRGRSVCVRAAVWSSALGRPLRAASLPLAVACLGSAGALLAGCGSRSSLRACIEPGRQRACEDVCGSGTQVCVDGEWTPCRVAPMSRGCSNDCGEGTQTCVDGGGWSSCEVPPASRGCSSPCGQGREACVDGGWQPCDAPQPGPPTFTATVRDFTEAHPDFEPDAGPGAGNVETGIVAADLGSDDKPVYAATASRTTHGAAYFDQWYRDVPGVNMTATLAIPLAPSTADPSLYVHDDNAFFPIDGRLFGNEGRPHNYDFTVELATTFRYRGGETLRFGSDDDSWVFVNRKLAVDLGGIHSIRIGTVDLDARSQDLGIAKGNLYPMHLFYAERHVVNAALHIDVPAADFAVCADGSMP